MAAGDDPETPLTAELLKLAGAGPGRSGSPRSWRRAASREKEPTLRRPRPRERAPLSGGRSSSSPTCATSRTGLPYIDKDNSQEGLAAFPHLAGPLRRDRYRGHLPGRHQLQRGVLRRDPPRARERSRPPGHDIIVITNGQELTEMIQLGYLVELDHSLTPNFNDNVGPSFKDPSFDPENVYTMAWQSGMTGIAWNTKFVDEAITSLEAMLDPKYAGHVGMFGNNADAANLAYGRDGDRYGDLHARRLAGGCGLPATVQRLGRPAQVVRPGLPDGLRERGSLDHDGVVGRRDPTTSSITRSSRPSSSRRRTPAASSGWTTCASRTRSPIPAGRDHDDGLVLQAGDRGPGHRMERVREPGAGRRRDRPVGRRRGEGRERTVLDTIASSPYVFPPPDLEAKLHTYRVLEGDEIEQWNDVFQPIFIS